MASLASAIAADWAESEHPAETHLFTREAMAASFTIRLTEADRAYARRAAAAAFEELATLESLLSCHVQNSDVSRINGLAPGQSTVVAVETFACLEIALDAKRKTGGAFDVCYAAEHRARDELFRLEEAGCTVRSLEHGLHIDLGGIGKGFALDRMAALLQEWDIAAAMLWASTSTVLAFGPPPRGREWVVSFGPPSHRCQRTIRGTALSASGTADKGEHVHDPRTGQAMARRAIAWATAPTAAMADALSTAFLVMSDEEIDRCCQQHPCIGAYLESP